ncbi:MAG: hypothetical protein ACLQME_05265 [Alphaproteobacteria bacterium]
MRRKNHALIGVSLAVLMAASLTALLMVNGCTLVPVNPNDMTPPSVVIKVKGPDGQYAPASTATYSASGGRLDLMCIVSDPQGVQAIQLSFLGNSDSCLVGGSPISGSYPIAGLPGPLQQSLVPNAQGQVPTELPLLATISSPLTCEVLGNPSQTGAPVGAQFIVQCTGQNWSSNPQVQGASATLTVSVN